MKLVNLAEPVQTCSNPVIFSFNNFQIVHHFFFFWILKLKVKNNKNAKVNDSNQAILKWSVVAFYRLIVLQHALSWSNFFKACLRVCGIFFFTLAPSVAFVSIFYFLPKFRDHVDVFYAIWVIQLSNFHVYLSLFHCALNRNPAPRNGINILQNVDKDVQRTLSFSFEFFTSLSNPPSSAYYVLMGDKLITHYLVVQFTLMGHRNIQSIADPQKCIP